MRTVLGAALTAMTLLAGNAAGQVPILLAQDQGTPGAPPEGVAAPAPGQVFPEDTIFASGQAAPFGDAGTPHGAGCACEEEKAPGCCFNTGEPFSISSWLLGEDAKVTFGGWTQLGVHSDSTGIFNNQPDRVNLHQQWLYIEKKADGSEGLDWGFRFDAIYGIDGENTQAFGNPPGTWDFRNGFGDGPRESWALPVLYGELAYGNTNVILGHFYTILGYEVVPAVGNFFYSHAFTFNFSEPFTHTGVLATTKLMDDDLTLYYGWTAGNDTGFDSVGDGGVFLGGFKAQLTDNAYVGYTTTVGDIGYLGNGYYHTALIGLTGMDGKLEYVLQNDVAKHDVSPTGEGDFDSVGLVNYLFYTVNDCVKYGTRAEWYRADGVDYYEVSVGMNFAPHANFVIRPEYRYQWSPEAQNGGLNPIGVPVDLGIFGVDAILRY